MNPEPLPTMKPVTTKADHVADAMKEMDQLKKQNADLLKYKEAYLKLKMKLETIHNITII